MELKIGDLFKNNSDVVELLSKFDPILSAATFAGLMTEPEIQSNCLRLEALVHLSLLGSGTTVAPKQDVINKAFIRMGESLRPLEDPAEDLFIASVHNSTGNYRILSGLSEGSAFYLQRLLDVVDSMPKDSGFSEVQMPCRALLTLSEELIRRTNLPAGVLGESVPADRLQPNICERLYRYRQFVRFTIRELEQLGIKVEDIAPFIYDLSTTTTLTGSTLFNSPLEVRPLVRKGVDIYYLLPTVIKNTLFRFVSARVSGFGQSSTLNFRYFKSYVSHLNQIPVLKFALMPWQRYAGTLFAAINIPIDPRNVFVVVFVCEDPSDIHISGFEAPQVLMGIEQALNHALSGSLLHETVSETVSNRHILLIYLGCGRPILFYPPKSLTDQWTIEVIQAHDFSVLGHLEEFTWFSAFRLLVAQNVLELKNITVINPNGFLNMFAWACQLNGHLVPHASLTKQPFTGDDDLVLLVDQQSLRHLRHKAFFETQEHRAPDLAGKWTTVKRFDKPVFDIDIEESVYVDIEALERRCMRSAIRANQLTIWVECKLTDGTSPSLLFPYWTMLNVWVSRIIRYAEVEILIINGPVLSLNVIFDICLENASDLRDKLADEQYLQSVNVSQSSIGVFEVNIREQFLGAFRHSDNLAERLLAKILLDALISPGNPKSMNLFNLICPNQEARQIHHFIAQNYRDYLPEDQIGEAIFLNEMDSASLSLGLAWRGSISKSTQEYIGRKECNDFLNRLVQSLVDEVQAELAKLNRHSVLRFFLNNIEAVERQRRKWRRTAQAVMALRDYADSAMHKIAEMESRFNSSGLTSRIILEAANSECRLIGGEEISVFGAYKMMALIGHIHHWGGYSDAIYWRAAEAYLKISPLGDVLFEQSFMNNIYEPFGYTGTKLQIQNQIKGYDKLYSRADTPVDVTTLLDQRFQAAWLAEFGLSLPQTLDVISAVEILDTPPFEVVKLTPRSVLLKHIADEMNISSEVVKSFLNRFIFKQAPKWQLEGKDKTQWYPWRFRREHSIVRRPFIETEIDSVPHIMYSPASINESLIHIILNHYEGEANPKYVMSSSMRKWLGTRKDEEGLHFNSKVAMKLESLGWKVLRERKLTCLLKTSLDKNYGDVDVLAWREDSVSIFAIECKDLNYHRTLGEVAEQLHDFRGEYGSDGKPDLLRKHLLRAEVLRSYSDRLRASLKISGQIEIVPLIVFSNPVPMLFVGKEIEQRIRFCTFSQLGESFEILAGGAAASPHATNELNDL